MVKIRMVRGAPICRVNTLFKHAYLNILKFLPPKKTRKNSDTNLIFFQSFAQNIDCGYSLEPPRRGGSNE